MLTLGRTVEKGTRILVAMSGGVDSALTAMLLSRAGYECVGINMRAYHPTDADRASGRKFQTCCSPEDAGDARSAANSAGMPFYVLDLEREFHDAVVAPFMADYVAGRTPNPCVLCNNYLKLGVLLDKAEAWGCDLVATGHYAVVEFNAVTGRYDLRRAADRAKDQTYYLFGLSQGQLSRFVCPLGGLEKAAVRQLAREMGLTVHDKPDSMEICFVPQNDYRAFLRQRLGEAVIRPGDIVTTDGRVLGRHDGIANFTVGQRKGLGVSSPEPMFVVDLFAEENLVVVGPASETYSAGLVCGRTNWIAVEEPSGALDVDAMIRYRSTPVPAVVRPMGGGQFAVDFAEPQRAVTPGQAVVFYDGDRVVGGGWIESRVPAAVKGIATQ